MGILLPKFSFHSQFEQDSGEHKFLKKNKDLVGEKIINGKI